MNENNVPLLYSTNPMQSAYFFPTQNPTSTAMSNHGSDATHSNHPQNIAHVPPSVYNNMTHENNPFASNAHSNTTNTPNNGIHINNQNNHNHMIGHAQTPQNDCYCNNNYGSFLAHERSCFDCPIPMQIPYKNEVFNAHPSNNGFTTDCGGNDGGGMNGIPLNGLSGFTNLASLNGLTNGLGVNGFKNFNNFSCINGLGSISGLNVSSQSHFAQNNTNANHHLHGHTQQQPPPPMQHCFEQSQPQPPSSYLNGVGNGGGGGSGVSVCNMLGPALLRPSLSLSHNSTNSGSTSSTVCSNPFIQQTTNYNNCNNNGNMTNCSMSGTTNNNNNNNMGRMQMMSNEALQNEVMESDSTSLSAVTPRNMTTYQSYYKNVNNNINNTNTNPPQSQNNILSSNAQNCCSSYDECAPMNGNDGGALKFEMMHLTNDVHAKLLHENEQLKLGKTNDDLIHGQINKFQLKTAVKQSIISGSFSGTNALGKFDVAADGISGSSGDSSGGTGIGMCSMSGLSQPNRKFKCGECKKQFKHKSNLRIHSIIHTDAALNCTFCPKKFARKSNLKQHLRVHTDERPYQCEHCQRRFKQTHSLKDHIRTHTGERPFKCDICPKAFKVKHNLVAHRRLHTGERPFQCKQCPKAFASKSSLNGHCKKLHPEFWSVLTNQKS